MVIDLVIFYLDEDGYDVVQVFECYDLIFVLVVDKGGKLIGCLIIDEMVDLICEESESEVFNMVGLCEEEDIFVLVWKLVCNCWVWLVINLIIVFVVLWVIGLFEGFIEKLVVLVVLMLIVVGIGGNFGNQIIIMIVCVIVFDQVQLISNSCNCLLCKEFGVVLVNGLVWGGVIGVVVFYFYGNWELGVVMIVVMILNLLLVVMMGVLILMILYCFGCDLVMGFSVMIIVMIDSGGFFIFFGLVMIFLMQLECYVRSCLWVVFFMVVRLVGKFLVVIRIVCLGSDCCY